MHSRLREQQKQPTKHLVMLQLEQRTRQNQHRKYSSQTMFSSVHFFFCCSSRVARIRLYVCFCCCCCRLFFCFSVGRWPFSGFFIFFDFANLCTDCTFYVLVILFFFMRAPSSNLTVALYKIIAGT